MDEQALAVNIETPLSAAAASDLFLLPGTLVSGFRQEASTHLPLRRILLTGATGFIGVHILKELLKQTDARIHCLVRAADRTAGLARLNAAMGAYGLDTGPLEDRVVIEIGDLGEPRCGLRPARWEALSSDIDAIVHNGASVNFVLPYSELRSANVDATRWLLRLAAPTACRFLYISTTMAVTPADGATQPDRNRILETDPHPPITALGGGYGQSKWAAERLVELGAAAGITAAILRVGTVIGDVRSGHRPEYQLQSRLATASMSAGLLPAVEGPIDLVPVEYIAQATIALLAPSGLPSEGVYHLANPRPLSGAEWQAAVRRLGLNLQVLPMEQWLAAMREAAKQNPDHPLASLVRGKTLATGLREIQQALPIYDCHRTLAALAESGVACPLPDDTLVARLLQTQP
ncbi:thioester reductase domain-containing protein [Pseudomonas sp. Q1]|uniref:thioester reductase domain-containing protein n=1 Tax=Pseudomonas sp. Q1 TaxID=2202823 RepID=UPI001374B71A|nr:thioester reductase domain-containing protein [Pseudomonas sp. Q1]NCE88443.1 hypothetical protein [Pseudomonas sp. Q1]